MLEERETIIGEFTINKSNIDKDKLYIYHKSGDGGSFSKKDFENAIEKAVLQFFVDNF